MGASDSNVRWERVVPEDESHGEWLMVRTPGGGRELKVVVMSADFEGTRIHYAGRTMPCPGEQLCDECKRGKAKRWRGYLLGQLSGTTQRVCVEFPAIAGKHIDRFYKEYQSLKGLNLSFYRANEKNNGRVCVKCNGMNVNAHLIQKVPDVREVCNLIWGVGGNVAEMRKGGMTCQVVSEAELHEREDGKIPHTALVTPTLPMFSAIDKPMAIDRNAILEKIAASAIANETSIEKVNRSSQARRQSRKAQ